jgi:hypothetical protein
VYDIVAAQLQSSGRGLNQCSTASPLTREIIKAPNEYLSASVLATDALCSSSDETHDALLTLYHRRFGQQIETANGEKILACWD